MFSKLIKLVGENLELIGEYAFSRSYFLKEINLKNVKKIDKAAFSGTSLKVIKNNHIQELN